MCSEKIAKRMDNPDDTLLKRQIAYAGDVLHEFHELPGEYVGLLVNEYPNADGGIPRVDAAYRIKLGGKTYIVNLEDESIRIDKSVLTKIDNYRLILEYFHRQGVISAIRTPLPIEKCLRVFKKSPTLCLHPWIISYADLDGAKRLSTIESIINCEETLSRVQAMDLVMIPKMFLKNQEEILEKVCVLLRDCIVEDSNFKLELTLQMRCVIHRYARTIEDIIRLEEVIGLQKAMTAMEFQNQALINQGINQGISQGISQGKFEIALKIMEKHGIEEAVLLSGFSREELESGKMNDR